ncbi:dienelactone hydrolase family protein [Paludibacterium paludis]|uniref:Carboxymethylenebutenolidase n=1 Tax=Paludibacterium paludis TaxID=1225769 RepID=A0A918UBR0_9NEIS|nr:dienelactone hydrolase family protein [Paludibacterium paludis]GGY25043.1 carboxymethylenebutenolidase [Paludibacterium paludis]
MRAVSPDATRRRLGAAASAGFALAVLPVSATTITTSAAGLVTDNVGIPRPDGTLPAYVARPAKPSGLLPVILVVQEIFGVHAHIRDLCRRLAHAGYFAIAPELYFRQGNPSLIHDIPTLMSGIVARVPDEQVMADLDATLAWAAAHGADDGRAGITGFCWGGRITWLYAARQAAVKAAVAWYGRLDGERTALAPTQPVDIAGKLRIPVLGLYGAEDTGIGKPQVDAMRAALEGTASRIVVYPGAGHGFNADYRPGYHPEAARDGWARMLAWFAANGVKP